MQHIEVLTSLPSTLSCIIMHDWLNLKSVVATNSAFCNHYLRSRFLELVKSNEYFVCEQVIMTNQNKILNVLETFGGKLRSLVFADVLFPEQVELVVKHCQYLTRVCFRCYHSSNVALQSILGRKTDCLGLSGIDQRNCSLAHITQLCPCLTTLGLACTHLTDNVLSAITISNPQIEQLDIADNKKLSDAGILNMLASLKSLRSLNIEGCASLTDASLQYITAHCANTLHTLQMSYRNRSAPWLSPSLVPSIRAICELLEKCTNLHTFSLKGCALPNGDHIIFPPTAFKNLTTLTLNGLICIASMDPAQDSQNLCTQLKTLKLNSLCLLLPLQRMIGAFSNLKEVQLKAGFPHGGVHGPITLYARWLESRLRQTRPGLIVTCEHPCDGYSNHEVLSL